MEAARLAEVDRSLVALGVGEARIAEILGAHRGSGQALSSVDAELLALAQGVAISAAPTRDRPAPAPAPPRRARQAADPALDAIELDDSFGSMAPPPLAAPSEPADIAEAPTRDLPQPDVGITEATTGSLPAIESEPPSDSGLSVDALFDEALAATAPAASEVVIGEAPSEPEEPMDLGLPVNVSEELAALLEGELDPREFEGGAAATAPQGDSDLAALLEPDAPVDLDAADVELMPDDEIGPEEHTVVASPSAMPPQPPTSPSQAPPDDAEKKGFFRKMFGK